MNHHLIKTDADWIEGEGQFAITGWSGNNVKECDARMALIFRFQKSLGSVKAASAYFEVSTVTWRAWRCGDKLPPATVCYHIIKLLKK